MSRLALTSHLRYNAIVRLREQTVRIRPEPVLKQLPCVRAAVRGVRVWHGAHTGPHQLAVGEDDFHSAVHTEVIYPE